MTAQDRLTLRNVYLYLVCLITLVVSLFAAVSLVRSTVGAFYPDPGYYGYYPYESPDGSGERLSDEEIARQEELAMDSQRRMEVLSLVGSAATLLIAGPLYVYHWRRVQKELPWRNGPDVPGGQPGPDGPQTWGGQPAPGGPQTWSGQQNPAGPPGPPAP